MEHLMVLIDQFFKHAFVIKLLDWPVLSFIALITILLRHRQSVDVLLKRIKVQLGGAADEMARTIEAIQETQTDTGQTLGASGDQLYVGPPQRDVVAAVPSQSSDVPLSHPADDDDGIRIPVQEVDQSSLPDAKGDTSNAVRYALRSMDIGLRVRGIISQLNQKEKDLLQKMYLGYDEPLREALEANFQHFNGVPYEIDREKMRQFEIIYLDKNGHHITSFGRAVAEAIMR